MSTETISYKHYSLPYEDDSIALSEVTVEFLPPANEPSLEQEVYETELEAQWSAEALMSVEEQFGTDVAQCIADWCAERPDQPAYKVIDNILYPLSSLMLGFTVSHGEESLDGQEITERLRRSSIAQATRAA